MTFEINIVDTKVGSFSNRAKDELKSQMIIISEKLVDEALRIETSERLSGDVQEVTSSIVQKASELILRRYDYVKRKTPRVYVEIFSLVTMSLSSVLFTIAFSNISSNICALYIALPFFAIGIVTSVLSIMNKV